MSPWLMSVCAAALALTFAGCASKPQVRAPSVFCPPPPDPPRLQFLTSIGSSLDIEKENKLLSFLTGQQKEPKFFTKPYGLALHAGKIFTCDTVGGLEVLDLEERTFEYWVPTGAGTLIKPIDVEIDNQGNRYIADVERGQVVIFDASGKYLGAIGSKETMKPTGVAVGGGRIYATNLNRHCIDVFDLATRKPLFSIPRDDKDQDARMFAPTNIALDSNLRLHVSDTAGFHIKIFDADGKLEKRFGEVGTGYGQMVRPKGIAVDRAGRVYNVDAATELVQIFNEENKLLLFFGKEDGAVPLVLPAGICIDYDHVKYFESFIDPNFEVEYLVLVTSQLGNRNLSVYGFGRQK